MMTGKYQRNTGNPNDGKRPTRRRFNVRAGGSSSECISRFPDGSVYLFTPSSKNEARRKNTTTATIAVKVPEAARLAAIDYGGE
jgi:hypothetical protein